MLSQNMIGFCTYWRDDRNEEGTKGENKEIIDVDDVIVNFGFTSSLGPIKEWGLEIEKHPIVVNTKQETNIPGIYAAGDIYKYEGKVKLMPDSVKAQQPLITLKTKSKSTDFTQCFYALIKMTSACCTRHFY